MNWENVRKFFRRAGCSHADIKVIGNVGVRQVGDAGASLSAFIGDSGNIYQCKNCGKKSYPRR